jgi:hypothetical protein
MLYQLSYASPAERFLPLARTAPTTSENCSGTLGCTDTTTLRAHHGTGFKVSIASALGQPPYKDENERRKTIFPAPIRNL